MTLKEWRQSRGLRTGTVAKQLGVCWWTWDRWERGRIYPPIGKWAAIETLTEGAITARDLLAGWVEWDKARDRRKR